MDCKVKENKDFNIFDIVTAPYMDIKGERKIGLFLVVYTENADPNDYNNRNLTGLKLTSKDMYSNLYRTLVTKEDVPNLDKSSYIYSNKFTVLMSNNCRFVDKLPTHLCEEVMNKLKVYLDQVYSQTFSEFINKLKEGDK